MHRLVLILLLPDRLTRLLYLIKKVCTIRIMHFLLFSSNESGNNDVFSTSFHLGSLTDNNNIRKLKDRNQNGMPDMTTTTVIVGADGSDSKDETDFLRKRITELKEPQVLHYWLFNNRL